MADSRAERVLDQEAEEVVRDPLARRWSKRRILLQSIGFVLGIGLFAWAVAMATSGDSSQYLARVLEAPLDEIALLVGLTAICVVFNGLCFWTVLRPIRRLNAIDVISVNAISTVLSILPFKISVISRAFIHNRRDGVDVRTLVAWLAAMSALSLAGLLPPLAATLWRGQADVLWWIGAIGGPIACTGAGVAVCKYLNGWRIVRISSIGGWRLIQHERTVAEQLLYRFVDLAALAGRFWVGAKIIGMELSFDQALLLGTGYYFGAVLAPAGTLGFAEMSATLLGAAVGHDAQAVTSLALLITVSQFPTALVMAICGWIRLRPDRLFYSPRVPVTGVGVGDG